MTSRDGQPADPAPISAIPPSTESHSSGSDDPPPAMPSGGAAMAAPTRRLRGAGVTYRTPTIDDGAAVWKLVDDTAAMDGNSAYAYFMVCRNFAATSVIAEVDGQLAGMLTAYPLPEDDRRLFVWQVSVDARFRGRGVAAGMLHHLLQREDCAAVRWIEATIAPGNVASEALFRRCASSLHANISQRTVYKDSLFPGDDPKPERLFVIGPIRHARNKIHLQPCAEGYRLFAALDDAIVPAFQPVNPVFSGLTDAMRAADAVCDAHSATEVVILDPATWLGPQAAVPGVARPSTDSAAA